MWKCEAEEEVGIMRCEDCPMLLALRMEKGPGAKGSEWPLKAGKCKEVLSDMLTDRMSHHYPTLHA